MCEVLWNGGTSHALFLFGSYGLIVCIPPLCFPARFIFWTPNPQFNIGKQIPWKARRVEFMMGLHSWLKTEEAEDPSLSLFSVCTRQSYRKSHLGTRGWTLARQWICHWSWTFQSSQRENRLDPASFQKQSLNPHFLRMHNIWWFALNK